MDKPLSIKNLSIIKFAEARLTSEFIIFCIKVGSDITALFYTSYAIGNHFVLSKERNVRIKLRKLFTDVGLECKQKIVFLPSRFGSSGSRSWSGKIPDPDPLSTKRPLEFKFSRYIKLSKIHFRPNNFLSLIWSVIRCLD